MGPGERVAMTRRAVGVSGSMVNNYRLTSRTADAGRASGEIRKVVGVVCATS